MCMFSMPVRSVTNTKIFARRGASNRQILVYEMNYEAVQDLAMILPLPTSRHGGLVKNLDSDTDDAADIIRVLRS